MRAWRYFKGRRACGIMPKRLCQNGAFRFRHKSYFSRVALTKKHFTRNFEDHDTTVGFSMAIGGICLGGTCRSYHAYWENTTCGHSHTSEITPTASIILKYTYLLRKMCSKFHSFYWLLYSISVCIFSTIAAGGGS